MVGAHLKQEHRKQYIIRPSGTIVKGCFPQVKGFDYANYARLKHLQANADTKMYVTYIILNKSENYANYLINMCGVSPKSNQVMRVVIPIYISSFLKIRQTPLI